MIRYFKTEPVTGHGRDNGVYVTSSAKKVYLSATFHTNHLGMTFRTHAHGPLKVTEIDSAEYVALQRERERQRSMGLSVEDLLLSGADVRAAESLSRELTRAAWAVGVELGKTNRWNADGIAYPVSESQSMAMAGYLVKHDKNEIAINPVKTVDGEDAVSFRLGRTIKATDLDTARGVYKMLGKVISELEQRKVNAPSTLEETTCDSQAS